jgi:hypothetical protein
MPTFVRYGRVGGHTARIDVGFAGDRLAAAEAIFSRIEKEIS